MNASGLISNIDIAVLAGGLGTRLREVMKPGTPKVLAPIAGRPFLSHLLDWLGQQGAVRESGQAVMQRLVPVEVALRLKPALRTGQGDARHGDERHCGEQGRDVESEDEPIGETHRGELLERS